MIRICRIAALMLIGAFIGYEFSPLLMSGYVRLSAETMWSIVAGAVIGGALGGLAMELLIRLTEYLVKK